VPGSDHVSHNRLQLIVADNHVESFANAPCASHPVMGCSGHEDKRVFVCFKDVKNMVDGTFVITAGIRNFVSVRLIFISGDDGGKAWSCRCRVGTLRTCLTRN
jgi:hypothetical protein